MGLDMRARYSLEYQVLESAKAHQSDRVRALTHAVRWKSTAAQGAQRREEHLPLKLQLSEP